MIEAQEKTLRKLAWYAQEKLWHEAILQPAVPNAFEPGFEVADCVGDLDTLCHCYAVDKAFHWYRRLHGPWWEQNQAYVPSMAAVVQLINPRGEVELDVNLDREDTASTRSLIDEMLNGDSLGDAAWFNRMLDSEHFSQARTQLRDLKETAETRKLHKERVSATATPAGGHGSVDHAMAGDAEPRPVAEAPLPKTEYICGQCEKRVFFTRKDDVRCDECGLREFGKPDAK
jgi:DNA-directed RNA polymerase subunit RPC12/RpoP